MSTIYPGPQGRRWFETFERRPLATQRLAGAGAEEVASESDHVRASSLALSWCDVVPDFEKGLNQTSRSCGPATQLLVRHIEAVRIFENSPNQSVANDVAIWHIPGMGWLATWGAERPSKRRGSGQLELHQARRNGRGGFRENAGRKRAPGTRTSTPHRSRPGLSRHVPVHITIRAAKGLPSLREQIVARAIGQVIRTMKVVREDFRIVEFSIQTNHLHLIVEADDDRSLSSAIRSFEARVSKVLNHHVLGRKRGKVWGDRYFRVDLESPRQARQALAYVLQNGHHHGVVAAGSKDPISSARWSTRYVTRAELPLETSPTSPSLTYMLNVLWERAWPGAISQGEVPG